jgi:dTDP-4-dehydrorhamnose 3,5-epimerase
MKILAVKSLALPEIKVITFSRFMDHRGYFTETFRRSDFDNHPDLAFMAGIRFGQANESFSRTGTIRGLHFQWEPAMGKLVRTVYGRMIDLVLDIRKGSPSFGKIIAYDMRSRSGFETGEWIWVPPGFAHGNLFLRDTIIEYFCTGQYNPSCEAGISPYSKDIDWSICTPSLRETFREIAGTTTLVTEKDLHGLSVTEWNKDSRSKHFVY